MANFTLQLGDCLETLKTLPDGSVDSVITDPPYGLSQHTPQQVADCLGAWLRGEEYKPKGKGFMGKSWDAWVPSPAVWRECLRVLKPGGHLLAFAGTRSMDLMSMAVRLAGFELRDSIGYAHDGGGAPLLAWAYGSGFPKSLDVSKAIDKAAGAEREVVGPNKWAGRRTEGSGPENGDNCYSQYGVPGGVTAPATAAARQWQGWGTALKPAWEPIILARKPLDGTVAENILAHGTGALNIDGCRVGTEGGTANGSKPDGAGNGIYGAGLHGACEIKQLDAGRWPANLIHDGSDVVLAGFPNSTSNGGLKPSKAGMIYANGNGIPPTDYFNYGDTGSAARFFYCTKASKRDRDDGNIHPTVKPTALMRYLCRLVTPPSGTVLDPFTGSGSTGKAAILEGFNFIGCEMQPDYHAIAKARIEAACTT